jgi:hypothetical protein
MIYNIYLMLNLIIIVTSMPLIVKNILTKNMDAKNNLLNHIFV